MTIAVPDLLTSLVLELRHELQASIPLRLHDRLPSSELVEVPGSVYDPETEKWKPDWSRMEALLDVGNGQSFSQRFVTHIGHRDGWTLNDLARSSIGEIADFCRSRHQSDLHRSPGRDTSLCERIVSGLAEFGQPLEHVAWREGIDPELAYALAVQALRHGASWRHRELHRYMRTARERERDSRVDCPACRGRVVVMRPRRRVA